MCQETGDLPLSPEVLMGRSACRAAPGRNLAPTTQPRPERAVPHGRPASWLPRVHARDMHSQLNSIWVFCCLGNNGLFKELGFQQFLYSDVKICYKKPVSPSGAAQLPPCAPGSRRFDPGSGHTPGLRVQPLPGRTRRQPVDASLPHRFSLHCPLSKGSEKGCPRVRSKKNQ